jgi:hypothetical protein
MVCSDFSARIWLLSEPHSRGVCSPTTYEIRTATNTKFTSPGCATPSGFLSLLTFCSTLTLSALFHAESVHGVETLRGFPLPVAATAFTARCPLSR